MSQEVAEIKEKLPDTPEEIIDITTCNPNLNLGPKNIPIELLIYYAEKNLIDEDIGKMVGCSRANVNQRLRDAGYVRKGKEIFNQTRVTILKLAQARILDRQGQFLSEDRSKIGNWRDMVDASKALGINIDKEQVLTGGRAVPQGITTHIKFCTDKIIMVQANNGSQLPSEAPGISSNEPVEAEIISKTEINE